MMNDEQVAAHELNRAGFAATIAFGLLAASFITPANFQEFFPPFLQSISFIFWISAVIHYFYHLRQEKMPPWWLI
ncbi:MAG: hypothetical protein NTX79_00390 [Candidatus Micrarchaeota archaeon]|nr:hypothetical protein [Candidatus Micrarchaeota archaeon]